MKTLTDHSKSLVCEQKWVYVLLMGTAGMMGAYTFTLRGGVFCNAQTANFVMMAVAFGQKQWLSGCYYLIPVFAYFSGAFLSEILPSPVKRLKFLRWDTYLIGLEILVLLAAGLIFVMLTTMKIFDQVFRKYDDLNASVQENVDMLYSVFYDYGLSQGDDAAAATQTAIDMLNDRFNMHGYQFTTNGTSPYERVNILEYDNSGRQGKYFDWDKAYFRTGVYQSYDMSVSGATQNTNYYTSLSYTKDDGRLRVNSLDACA